MSRTIFRWLTPPGSGAVAVVALEGPHAATLVQTHFRRANGKPLTVLSPGFLFGRFGSEEISAADEVVLRIHDATRFEIHTHGGPQVLAWLTALLQAHGAVEELPAPTDPWILLAQTRTTRTARIMLEQCHGAYARALAAIAAGDMAQRDVLARNANVGRHLVKPWRVALAGLPNAGKSSLMNALAGFDRSIVSPLPGTTRDAVTVSLAFDGWPVDVIDTAGLRTTTDAIEHAGIDRTMQAIATCDLCLWLHDATTPFVPPPFDVPSEKLLVVFNKADLATAPTPAIVATTGQGLKELVTQLVTRLVPHVPAPGDAVPYLAE